MDEEERSSGGRRRREAGNIVVSDGDGACGEAAPPATFDWRGRPADPRKHGGMTAASFVLGLQGMEITAIAAVGNNLITYAMNEMHFSLSKSANAVTNFVGTLFISALLGGYLSDAYLGSFWTILFFGCIELSGFILLAVQAHVPQLKPPKCNMFGGDDGVVCEEAKGCEALIFFLALYLVALGSGCVKPNMISLGADQFDTQRQPKLVATYFNAAYFAFSTGELVALTLLVWLQTHSGMDVGFAASAAAMALGLISLVAGVRLYRNKPPRGRILTPIAQVLVAAFIKRKNALDPSDPIPNSTTAFRWLNKACIKENQEGSNKENPWRVCSVSQVEQVKTLISIIPIFACTIVFNTILAQLQTFSVQQATTMDTKLPVINRSFHIPPASLQAIPYILLIVLVPLYDAVFVPLARRIKGDDQDGVTPLQRIGLGLLFATLSMASAALAEARRRSSAAHHRGIISVFWLAPQYVIFGVSEMFAAVGLIEFFYKQPLNGMQACATAITYCSYSFGFYLSSVLVSLVNKITARRSSSGGGGWLADNDLNKDRLDLFYWLLAALSLFNFLNYLFWSRWYSRLRLPPPPPSSASHHHELNTNKKKGIYLNSTKT
ncbi:unnamed protein product [Cuscuta campestris]|uniref:Major facilitator superfamily (MFS) profile domain-containing protein n=1 Tax=Cuscuta campestris TaxID=132261 RepID=A0A484MLD0_9ASTE|nr:unnamed protein product [Cuscuta campestris]